MDVLEYVIKFIVSILGIFSDTVIFDSPYLDVTSVLAAELALSFAAVMLFFFNGDDKDD